PVCTEDGSPIRNLSYPYDRWRYVLEKTRIPYREPYNARHSFVSWRLMVGHNVLLVAKEDGHSPHTMRRLTRPGPKGRRKETLRRSDDQWSARPATRIQLAFRPPTVPGNPPDLPLDCH